MKKTFQILFIFLFAVINAQNTANRFFYELTYKPNKDSAKLEKEMMALDIDQNKSVYQSYELIGLDSLANVMVTESLKTGNMADVNRIGGKKQSKFLHRIFKTHPVQEIVYNDQILMDYYSYRENPNLIWKISDEKQKIGAYNTQKATTDFGGRKWTAWFTTEIPFQDGPYKFYGLPGLIVKIEDDGKNYSWELKGNRKIDHIKDTLYMEGFIKQSGLSSSKEIPKEKFLEKYEQYKKDPLASMRQLLSQLPAGVDLPDNSITEKMREAEKKMKEELAKNNNSIEIQEKINKRK
ncbi:GLPGLI family protein [Chryseobacterium defluvii]|uniref:GLPGLI family protein n=1 Tax=Chryseobacterium defluvii TaxID=160396 RepID=A0A495SBC5_9FLAO|nr:GLPGLI family protein [Chryseobacterium defluvii]RKS96438.1 GLPGLI family protein [Chryseobacterium defluvii]